MTNLISINR